jgi:hypothetical protein
VIVMKRRTMITVKWTDLFNKRHSQVYHMADYFNKIYQ